MRLLKSFLDDPGLERSEEELHSFLVRWLIPDKAPYMYGATPAAVKEKTNKLQAICEAHAVPLAAVALQLPRTPRRVGGDPGCQRGGGGGRGAGVSALFRAVGGVGDVEVGGFTGRARTHTVSRTADFAGCTRSCDTRSGAERIGWMRVERCGVKSADSTGC